MQRTYVDKHLPDTVPPVINDFNNRVAKLDKRHKAETPTQIDWTDLARASVTMAKARDSAEVIPLLQEVMAAKRAILGKPGKPDYITEDFLNKFAAEVATAVQSMAANVTAGRSGGSGGITRG